MTILAWPAGMRAPSAATLLLRSLTQTAQSPFDGSMQTLALPGQRWHATLTWQPMAGDLFRPLAAFVASLRGPAGRFTYCHPQTWRRATATVGAPVVNGAGQTGATLAARGYAVGAVVHLAGDFISFADPAGRQRLHMITADVTSDGLGDASLPIAPPLRTSPADGAAIETAAPLATWMLADDSQGEFAAAGSTGGRVSVSLAIEEALV